MKVYEVSSESINIELYDVSMGELSREEKRELDFYIKAEFVYPIIKTNHEDHLKNVNKMLKYVPFDLLGYGYYDTQKMVDGELEPLSAPIKFWESMISSYTILYHSSEYLSVEFSGTISNKMRVNTRKCFVTFNLSTGKIVSVQELIGVDEMIGAIGADAYEVVEGTYLPGGWEGTEPQMKEGFSTAIIQATSREEHTDPDRIVNTDSIYHFGLTEDSILLSFAFEDSLNGYVVLKFDKDAST